MSVPDFKTSTIDQEVMGWKLARIIDGIQRNYKQNDYNRRPSQIRYEQTEDSNVRFSMIDKLDFVDAEKSDSVILLRWHTLTKLDKKHKAEHDLTFMFVNGVSESELVNNFFKDISRYIRPDEVNE